MEALNDLSFFWSWCYGREKQTVWHLAPAAGCCGLYSLEGLNVVFYQTTHWSESSSPVHGMRMRFDMPMISSARRIRVGAGENLQLGSFPAQFRRGRRRKEAAAISAQAAIMLWNPGPDSRASWAINTASWAGCLMSPRWWDLKGACEQVVIMTDTVSACADMQPRNKTLQLANKNSGRLSAGTVSLCVTLLKQGGGREALSARVFEGIIGHLSWREHAYHLFL